MENLIGNPRTVAPRPPCAGLRALWASLHWAPSPLGPLGPWETCPTTGDSPASLGRPERAERARQAVLGTTKEVLGFIDFDFRDFPRISYSFN